MLSAEDGSDRTLLIMKLFNYSSSISMFCLSLRLRCFIFWNFCFFQTLKPDSVVAGQALHVKDRSSPEW